MLINLVNSSQISVGKVLFETKEVNVAGTRAYLSKVGNICHVRPPPTCRRSRRGRGGTKTTCPRSGDWAERI